MHERLLNKMDDDRHAMGQFLLDMSSESESERTLRRTKIIRAAINNELTDRQRAIVIKYFYEHMSALSIAKELGISKATVYKHLRRAREKLMKCAVYY